MNITKDDMRNRIFAERQGLPEELEEKLSQIIQDKLLKSPFWPKKGAVGLYAPVKHEVGTHKIFQTALEQALAVYFPRVEQGIQFYEVIGPDDLERGSWSIPEPKRHCTILAPERRLDLLVVPGIVFSKNCDRIGYGKGFYDKFMVDHAVPSVALAYDFQLVDSFVVEAWDHPLDAVITEKRICLRDKS